MRGAEPTFAVLDIETVPCADAMSMAVRGREDPRRQALHRICSAAMLIGRESDQGFSNCEVAVFTNERLSEVEILGCMDLLCPDPDEEASRLIVYNGSTSDLRNIRLRLGANWLFAHRKLARWTGRPTGRIVDLINQGLGGSRPRWSLSDLCAGLGFPMREGLLAQSVVSMAGKGRWDVVAEHNMMDVVGTFLAYATDRSIEKGSDIFASTAWVECGRMLEEFSSVNKGRERFTRHHLLEEARARSDRRRTRCLLSKP